MATFKSQRLHGMLTDVDVSTNGQVLTITVVLPDPVSVTDKEDTEKVIHSLLEIALAPEWTRPYYGGDESVGDYVRIP